MFNRIAFTNYKTTLAGVAAILTVVAKIATTGHVDLTTDLSAIVAGVAQFRDMGRAIAVAVQTSDAEIRQLSFTAAANEMRDSKWARHDSPARAERRAREMTTGTLARG